MRPLILVLASLTLAPALYAPAPPPASPEPERIAINRNVRPAGALRDGVLTLRLDARRGRWHPEADDGIGIDVHAFGESGRPLEVPGPLVRVPVGTEVRLSVRNGLDSTLVLRGLHARPVAAGDTIQVAPGATRTVTFALREVGTFLYWGRTSADTSVAAREGADSQLTGALLVDSLGAPPTRDRVLVLGAWARTPDDPQAKGAPWGQAMVVNGKSWPHTERLSLAVGDTVRWRIVNASPRAHPMHLHGFYFHVESRGDATRDSTYEPRRQRLGVTELMLPRSTMAVHWVPDRPGNWLLHCHFTAHVGPHARLHAPLAGADPAAVLAAERAADAGPHGGHGMHGLAVGLQVRPAAGTPTVVAVAQRGAPRAMRLLVHERVPSRDGEPALAYVLQRGDVAPAEDSLAVPGSTLVLTRGEPVRITVVNRTRRPTAVHWHGLEIESFPDGVPGWSGTPDRLMPAIAPRDSFVAEFTPPRAGTFMYHAHLDEQRQIGAGLYGAIVVVEPGRGIDSTERILVFSREGALPGDGGVTLVNGRASPDTVELTAGVAHRLRLVFIQPNGAMRMRLRGAMPGDTSLVVWRPLAKDGADLPPAFTRPRSAIGLVAVGETYDYEFTPRAPGVYRMDFEMRVVPGVFAVVLRAR
ncbi:MAG: multicopper oxidase domain-containing protein [Gemmatirosa sp.]